MPIHDYKCECGEKLGDHRHNHYDDEIKCPKCGKVMERLEVVDVAQVLFMAGFKGGL